MQMAVAIINSNLLFNYGKKKTVSKNVKIYGKRSCFEYDNTDRENVKNNSMVATKLENKINTRCGIVVKTHIIECLPKQMLMCHEKPSLNINLFGEQ